MSNNDFNIISEAPTIGTVLHCVEEMFLNESLITSSENSTIALIHSNYFVFVCYNPSSDFELKLNISFLPSFQFFTRSADVYSSTDISFLAHSFVHAGSSSVPFVQVPFLGFVDDYFHSK